MQRLSCLLGASAIVLCSSTAGAQQPNEGARAAAQQANVQPAGQRAQSEAERTARRFRMGLQGGVGLDPEILDVAAHMTVGPVFNPNVDFRPAVELGVGEITTLFAINLDVLYRFRGALREEDWTPYVGAGPTFGLSHRTFETDELDHLNLPPSVVLDDRNRFDFGDTDFNGGMNFVVGMQRERMFFEMKATAWGVSVIRLLAGVTF